MIVSNNRALCACEESMLTLCTCHPCKVMYVGAIDCAGSTLGASTGLGQDDLERLPAVRHALRCSVLHMHEVAHKQ